MNTGKANSILVLSSYLAGIVVTKPSLAALPSHNAKRNASTKETNCDPTQSRQYRPRYTDRPWNRDSGTRICWASNTLGLSRLGPAFDRCRWLLPCLLSARSEHLQSSQDLSHFKPKNQGSETRQEFRTNWK